MTPFAARLPSASAKVSREIHRRRPAPPGNRLPSDRCTSPDGKVLSPIRVDTEKEDTLPPGTLLKCQPLLVPLLLKGETICLRYAQHVHDFPDEKNRAKYRTVRSL